MMGIFLDSIVEKANNLENLNLVGANDAPIATTNILGPSASGNNKNLNLVGFNNDSIVNIGTRNNNEDRGLRM